MKNKLLFIFFLGILLPLSAQESDTLAIDKKEIPLKIEETGIIKEEYDPLAPSRAAFYSAVVPGLGQVQNKKYWKIPIIYAGMATGVYFYKEQNKDYNRFRDAYKRRLAGFKDDEFYGPGNEPMISNDRLINAQRSAQKNKNISVMVVAAFYLLNIIDANVDAHLKQYEVMEDLSIKPNLEVDPLYNRTNYGLVMTFNF